MELFFAYYVEILKASSNALFADLQLHGNLPSLQLTFSPTKWEMFRSFFSSHSEEEMAGDEGMRDSIVPVAGMRDNSLHHESPAPYFELELISKTLSLSIHSDEDERLQRRTILLSQGESASLT